MAKQRLTALVLPLQARHARICLTNAKLISQSFEKGYGPEFDVPLREATRRLQGIPFAPHIHAWP
jgi:hypothetical protein